MPPLRVPPASPPQPLQPPPLPIPLSPITPAPPRKGTGCEDGISEDGGGEEWTCNRYTRVGTLRIKGGARGSSWAMCRGTTQVLSISCRPVPLHKNTNIHLSSKLTRAKWIHILFKFFDTYICSLSSVRTFNLLIL